MVDGVLSGHDRGTGRGGAWLGIGGGEDQALVSNGVNIWGWVTDRNATTIETDVHPAHVIQKEDNNVGFLAGFFQYLGQFSLSLFILFRMHHHRHHIVGDRGGCFA